MVSISDVSARIALGGGHHSTCPERSCPVPKVLIMTGDAGESLEVMFDSDLQHRKLGFGKLQKRLDDPWLEV
jgi:hypothetical protein